MLPPPPHSTQPSGVKTQKIQSNSTQKHTKNQPKALSLGVSAYSPWDLEMANRGFLVLEFDASIENSPYPNHPNIKFFKQFVGAKDSNENGVQTIAFSRLLKECEFDTNAHNVLQCDIENAEWEILEQCDMSLLARYFSQMTFEFHQCYPDDEAGCEPRFRVLEKIREHFVPIWVHYNSAGDGLIIGELKGDRWINLPFVPLMEVTYLRKDLLPKDAQPCKSGLYRLNTDSPNVAEIPDIPVIFP